MLPRRRSSAASATLAKRTKPTTPTTSPRSSSRPDGVKRGRDLLSPFFCEPSVCESRLRARNYEIPTPNLRNAGGGTYRGFGSGSVTRSDGGGGQRSGDDDSVAS